MSQQCLRINMSVMAIMYGSSFDIRTSSWVNLFLRHGALKEYIFLTQRFDCHR